MDFICCIKKSCRMNKLNVLLFKQTSIPYFHLATEFINNTLDIPTNSNDFLSYQTQRTLLTKLNALLYN